MMTSLRVFRKPIAALAVSFAFSGCLVESPPEFENPERSAPILYVDRASPPPTEFITIPLSGAPIPITVPFRADDLGSTIRGGLYIDYGLSSEAHVDSRPAPPGNDGEIRELQLSLSVNDSRLVGCHPMTLIVTHEDNLDRELPPHPIDPNLATTAVWWVLIQEDPGQVTISDCGRKAEETTN